MKSINGLLLMVIELIILIIVLAALTPTVLTNLTNLSATLVANGVSIGSILAANVLGGILWFVLCLLIVAGVIFAAINAAKGGKGGY